VRGAGAGQGGACVEAGAPCQVTFHYPLGSEQSVELRGDFAPDGWDNGIPLEIDAGEWRITLSLPNDSVVRYKYLVDGSEWVTDPTNPVQEDDGLGGLQSVRSVSCGASCDGAGGQGEGGLVQPRARRVRLAQRRPVLRLRRPLPRTATQRTTTPVAGVETPANYQGGDYAGLLEQIEAGYFDDLGVNALWLTVPADNPSVSGLWLRRTRVQRLPRLLAFQPRGQVEEHFGDDGPAQGRWSTPRTSEASRCCSTTR
jgi:hypothetical protein